MAAEQRTDTLADAIPAIVEVLRPYPNVVAAFRPDAAKDQRIGRSEITAIRARLADGRVAMWHMERQEWVDHTGATIDPSTTVEPPFRRFFNGNIIVPGRWGTVWMNP